MENKKESKQPVLQLTINGKTFDWHDEYITGIKLKELGSIDPNEHLFLVIEAPWENELIPNDGRINLARPGIEAFISKEMHPDYVILTIETPKGKWENVSFSKTLLISQLIEKVIKKFEFAPDGNYKLKIKGQEEYLDNNRPLVSYHLKDHTVLVFTDLGKGA